MGVFMFKVFVLAMLSVVSIASADYSGYQGNNSGDAGSGWFPTKPDATMTPGMLCQHADSLRYPEKIKYCSRNVDTMTKNRVIQMYDAKFGYKINPSNRNQFKIDHYIPLCMGGSNEVQNLWPHHQSVYTQTDPLEPLLCEKKSEGRLKQVEAVQLIKKGKNDFSQIKGIIDYEDQL